jgi:hypothetical protein
VLELARQRDVGVLVNRPLNAIVGEGMLRLASVAPQGAGADLEGQLAILAGLESEYRRDLASRLRVQGGGASPDQFFRWSLELGSAAAHVRGLEHWEALESQRILPRVMQAVQALDHALEGEIGRLWRDWRGRYLAELQRALDELRRRAAEKSRAVVDAVAAALDPLLPPERRGESLSRKALWVVSSTPGVSSTLNGMRRPEYVADALGILEWAPLPDAARVYERMRDLELH